MRSPWKWRAIKPVFAALLLLLAGCGKSSYGPREALKTFQVDPAFRVEPFASEPMVVSPVAMDFDENGRAYVVENRGPDRGRVKLLEDLNGDGIPDRSTIFADNLAKPDGVMRWKDGILVSDSSGLFYMVAGKVPGKPDMVRIDRENFVGGNLIYGLDNQVHQSSEAFDPWGHRFVVTPSEHIRYEAIAARYLNRGAGSPASWKIAPIADHQVPSARGLTYFNGAMFVADPVRRVVHEDVLYEAGATYTARRAREGAEFLSSSDPNFQPVNLAQGPDGALYVMDLYHSTIAVERGRIYRIVPQVADPTGPKTVRLGAASNRELAHALESSSLWVRRTAQRLLVDRNQLDSVADIARVTELSLSPEGRVHALWTLDGMRKLNAVLIARALDDPEPGVRENAIILAESQLAQTPGLAAKLTEMTDDASPKVRFQLLLTLGSIETPAAKSACQRLLAHDSEDRWVRRAAALFNAGSPR